MTRPRSDITRGWRGWRGLAPLGLAPFGLAPFGLALAAAAPALASPQGLYDESRVLERRGTACLGQADCVTVESRQARIAKGESTILQARCPAGHPYVAGWDTEQHEHLVTTALPPKPRRGADPDAPVATSGRIEVAATNNGETQGRVTLLLGCVASPPRVTAVMKQRSGVPSNHAGFSGGSR
jgi:hypothetical protein